MPMDRPSPGSYRPGEPPRANPAEQIILQPNAPAAARSADGKSGPSAASSESAMVKDAFREVIETVVFVVVLVLLLKTFLAEAFVIPTGSMATTLLGYHRQVPCDACGYTFPVNASQEVEPPQGQPAVQVTHGVCPNCQKVNEIGRGPRR